MNNYKKYDICYRVQETHDESYFEEYDGDYDKIKLTSTIGEAYITDEGYVNKVLRLYLMLKGDYYYYNNISLDINQFCTEAKITENNGIIKIEHNKILTYCEDFDIDNNGKMSLEKITVFSKDKEFIDLIKSYANKEK